MMVALVIWCKLLAQRLSYKGVISSIDIMWIGVIMSVWWQCPIIPLFYMSVSPSQADVQCLPAYNACQSMWHKARKERPCGCSGGDNGPCDFIFGRGRGRGSKCSHKLTQLALWHLYNCRGQKYSIITLCLNLFKQHLFPHTFQWGKCTIVFDRVYTIYLYPFSR